jgi:hypothetical protein
MKTTHRQKKQEIIETILASDRILPYYTLRRCMMFFATLTKDQESACGGTINKPWSITQREYTSGYGVDVSTSIALPSAYVQGS